MRIQVWDSPSDISEGLRCEVFNRGCGSSSSVSASPFLLVLVICCRAAWWLRLGPSTL